MRLNFLSKVLPVLLGLLVLAIPVAAIAQEAETSPTDAAAESGAPSGADAAPTYPAGLDDEALALEELRLRITPLTAEELAPLALAWRDRARDITGEVVDLTLRAREAAPEEANALTEERAARLAERRAVFDKFAAVVSSLEAKGGDPAVIKELRSYRAAISSEETANLTPTEIAQSVVEWMVSPDGGIQLAIRIAVIVASLLGLLIVARIVRGWARRLFGRVPNLSRLLQGFLAMAIYWLTIAVGLMIVLSALGVNVTPLFALVGGASFIIAFAMQDTLGNLAAGLMIMINRPFDEGDYVTIAGKGGTVRKVSVVSTTISTPDNQVIIIPNSKVWGDVITNVTASDTRRVDMVFGIGYEDSIEKAQEVLEGIVAAHPKVLADPAPLIRVNELGQSSVNFIVRPWVRAEDYWDVYWELTQTVKEAFDQHGLTIPFPQTEMRIRASTEGNPSVFKPV